jgi:CheY-like chemotaxis protein
MRPVSISSARSRRATSAQADRRVPVIPNRVREAFATALVEAQMVTPLAIQSAIEHSAEHGMPVPDAVVALGLVDERAAYRLLARAAGMPFHDGAVMEPSPLALKLVPERVARQHELLPVAVDDRSITYLTATPYDVDGDRDVKVSTGRAPIATLTCPSELRAGLTRVYANRMDVSDLLALARTGVPAAGEADKATLDTPSDSAIVNLCDTLAMRDRGRAEAGVTSEDEIARAIGADGDAAGVALSCPKPSILIADDEPITRTLVRLLLERDGHKVVEAQTGEQAIDLAVQHSPDLIVMDLKMPQMDGYEAIAELRRNPAFTGTPIVVVTAEEGPAIERRVLALGADDYIVKPFDPAVLTARVKAVFKRQQLAA